MVEGQREQGVTVRGAVGAQKHTVLPLQTISSSRSATSRHAHTLNPTHTIHTTPHHINQSQVVTKMAMLDNGRARIDWTLSGQLSAFNLPGVSISSVFELNLLTGRVINHT